MMTALIEPVEDQAMAGAPIGTAPLLPVAAPERPQAVMRGKRHFLNLEGETAARAGLPDTSAPYDAGSLENIGWLEGWARGRAMLENRESTK